MRKIAWRLVPLLSVGYLINALDRFNISFAALTMNKALGLSATAYGLGAGAFFWSYVLFQVPANLVLTRLGARRWIMMIMIVWGVCSAGAALVTGVASFVIVRFMLGIAEAGFFPGVAFIMTRWFPARYRGRAMGVVYAFGATAGIIGGPVSAHLLGLDGWLGLAGWQWVFLLEGPPAILLAFACPFLLRDRPAEAHWLSVGERVWLQQQLDSEAAVAVGRHLTFARAIASPVILVLTAVYFLLVSGSNGKEFFLPLMIKGLGYSTVNVGYVTSLPAVAGVIGMVCFSQSSDRTGERLWHLLIPCVLGGVGLIMAGLSLQTSPTLAIAAFCVSSFGIAGALPVYWNLPTAFLGSAAAAAGIAFINSIGGVAGYAAPQLVGILRDSTGSYELPMVIIGMAVITAGLLVPLSMHRGTSGPVQGEADPPSDPSTVRR